MSPPIKNDVSCTGHFRTAGSSKSVSEQSSLLREVLGVYQVLASPKSYEEIGNQPKFILNTTATQDKAQYNKQSISPLPLGMSSASLTPLRTTASLSKEFQEAPVHISANSTSVQTKPLNLPDEPVKLRGLKRLMSPNTTINLKRSMLDVGKLKPRRVPEEMTPLKNAIPGASQSPGFIKLKTGTGSVPVKLMNGASKSPSSTVSAIPLSTSSGPVNFQEVKLLFVSQPGVNKEGKNTLQMNMLRSGTDDRLIALHSADGKQTRLINIGSARLDNSTSIHATINSLLAAQPAAASNQQGQKLFPSVIDSIKPIDAVSAMLPEVSIVLQQQNGENRIDTVRNTNECDFDIAMSTIGKEKCRSQNALLARKNVTVSQAVPCTVICPQISNSKQTVTLRCATPKEKVVPGSVSKLMTIKDAERIGTYSSLVENQSTGTIHH